MMERRGSADDVAVKTWGHISLPCKATYGGRGGTGVYVSCLCDQVER